MITVKDDDMIGEMEKRSFSYFHWLIFFLLGLLAVKTIQNPDLFWHLKVGEDIVKTFSIPFYDSYSYHEGLRFFAHEWLFDVIISSIYGVLGIYGVLAFMQITGVATSIMVYKNLKLHIHDDSFTLFMCFCIAGMYISMFLVPRPQMLSSLLSLILLYLLERWLWTEDEVSVNWLSRYAAIALISIIWINIHGGSYPLFFIILAGHGFEKLIVYYNSRESIHLNQLLRLISIGICALVAFCINPYGIKMLLFPLLLTGDPTTYLIQEWKSPVFHGVVGIIRYLLIALPLIILMSSKKDVKTRAKFYVVLFTFMALSSVRHTSLLVLFNYTYVASHFFSLVKESWGRIIELLNRLVRKRNVVLAVMTVLVLAIGCRIWVTVKPIDWNEYPLKALAYIDEQEINLEEHIVFNQYGWGGYMLFSDYPVFIDGRADVYQEKINPQSQVMNDYGDMMGLVEPDKILDKYSVEYVLYIRDGILTTYLRMSPNWELLYESEEENSVLFVRSTLSE